MAVHLGTTVHPYSREPLRDDRNLDHFSRMFIHSRYRLVGGLVSYGC